MGESGDKATIVYFSFNLWIGNYDIYLKHGENWMK